MSNRVTMKQYTRTDKATGNMFKFIEVFDDYEYDFICLDDYQENFFDDELELLKFVIQVVIDNPCTVMESLFDYVVENEMGISIENNWYDWNEIKDLFNEYCNK
jgi:hypothetical protein